MAEYLKATGRGGIAELATDFKEFLQPDPNTHYDKVIEVSIHYISISDLSNGATFV